MNGLKSSVFFLIANLICFADPKVARSYEATPKNDAPEVVKFSHDAWEIFRNRSNNITASLKLATVLKVRVLVVGEERRYTMLVIYRINESISRYYCIVFVRTKNNEPIFVQCYKAPIDFENPNKYDEGMMEMYNYFYWNM
ncbi:Protein of unknown function [Cotesia congregata]|uniref:Cystatin domain-containing protein n=1 Tax=Cotesia congregata TaxID=51543 RepID=A0A8J2EC86_COTCN|nr:Protein of unknown function [Cotesia congregata]